MPKTPDLFDLPFEEDDSRHAEPGAWSEPAYSDDESLSGDRAPSDDPARPLTGPVPPPSNSRSTPLDRQSPSARRQIFSVTELNVRIRDLLESEFMEVWVEGEISNCRKWNTGHFYFTLKDDQSQLRAVMFRSAVRYLTFKLEDGLRVVARGRMSVYEPKGEYQLVCEHLEPHGLGALQLAFEQLKKRLEAEGLFDAARKRPLPALPRKIGVVTSLDGAAIRDIVKVLRRRYGNAHLVIRPARVQGEGAAAEIARGLRAIGRVQGVDVVIVGRGGGSIEDLWAFNEEVVARAIAACPIPVISAVGHEVDFTIADFVADVRAPTPSAAAEIVVSRKDEFCGRIDRLHDRLRAAVGGRILILSRRVHAATARPAFSGFGARIAMRGRHLGEETHALARAVRDTIAGKARRLQLAGRRLETFDAGRRLGAIRARLIAGDGRLAAAIGERRYRADMRLRSAAVRLEAMSPLAVLGRGYAVAWNADRTSILRDASAVSVGDRVNVTLATGELRCDVIEKTDGADDGRPLPE